MKSCLLVLVILTSAWSQELRRPSIDSDGGANYKLGCAAQSITSSAMPLAHDAAGQATQSTISVASIDRATGRPPEDAFYQAFSSRIFSAWQTRSFIYSSLTLSVNSLSAGSDGPGIACVSYSINGGTSWTSIHCSSAAWSQSTSTITLSPIQDLSQLMVGVCVKGGSGSTFGADSLAIYDIWTTGLFSNSNTGNGSGAGQPQRGLVILN